MCSCAAITITSSRRLTSVTPMTISLTVGSLRSSSCSTTFGKDSLQAIISFWTSRSMRA